VQREPLVDKFEEGGVECGNAPQPRGLTLAPIKPPEHRKGHQSEQAREAERPQEPTDEVRAHAGKQAQLDKGRGCQHHQQRSCDSPPAQALVTDLLTLR
jgi:hypothetical protein